MPKLLKNRAHSAIAIMPSNRRILVLGGLGDERGIEYLDITKLDNTESNL